MAEVSAFPKAGDVKPCSECGQMTAVYTACPQQPLRVPSSGGVPGGYLHLRVDLLALRPRGSRSADSCARLRSG